VLFSIVQKEMLTLQCRGAHRYHSLGRVQWTMAVPWESSSDCYLLQLQSATWEGTPGNTSRTMSQHSRYNAFLLAGV